ncbi:MAG: phenylacetate--CoA ligase family protein [Bryobacteraceae bacterium]
MTALGRRLAWSAFTAWHARAEAALPFRPLETILGIQTRRVKAIVRHAYDSVPFYRRAMEERSLRPGDIACAADLARLPLIDGRLLAGEPASLRSRREPTGLRIESSGTSGRAKHIDYDAAALFLALAHGHRQRAVMRHFVGRVVGYREMLIARPSGVSHQMRQFYETHSWTPRGIDLQRQTMSGDASIEDQVAAINAFQPEVLVGYGSYLGAFLRRAVQRGLVLWRPRVIGYGADAMDQADRDVIERDLGVPVLSFYQSVEALRLAFQCEARQGLHLFIDCMAVRVVRDDGGEAGPGEPGHIVISNLTNRATVLLNYKLGDVVTVARGACACGRTLPRIERIDGRSDDLVRLADGRILHSLVVLEPLRAVPGVGQTQVIQRRRDNFLLRVVPRPGIDCEEAGRRLKEAFRARAGAAVEVEVEWCESIPPGPNGKVKAVISEVREHE